MSRRDTRTEMREIPIHVEGSRAELFVPNDHRLARSLASVRALDERSHARPARASTPTVDRPRGLTLEADRERRLRLVLDDAPVAWGRVAFALAGIAWVRSARAESLAIVPPIRANEARAHATPESWARTFAHALASSPRSPLRPGRWEVVTLRSHAPDAHWDDRWVVVRNLSEVLEAPVASFVQWPTCGGRSVTPLRAASREDAARVKAFRKLAREGVLPPLLLWWVAALDGCVLLDGHDRVLAAQLEGVAPRAVLLRGVRDEPPNELWRQSATEGYARAFANEPLLSPRTRTRANEGLVRAFGGERYATTPSVARLDLAARFADELREVRDPTLREHLFA